MMVEWRGTGITKIAADSAQLDALRLHLEEVIKGDSFRGSPRGQQFLLHVIEKAIEGDFDSLKERMIGMELFRRSPSYDTSGDAIVRVTANDVRKRLQQHYARHDEADFRIELHPGSYIPDIIRLQSEDALPAAAAEEVAALEPARPASSEEAVQPPEPEALPAATLPKPLPWRALLLWSNAALIVLLLAGLFWIKRQPKLPSTSQPSSFQPWSALLEPGRTLQIVASDPDFATLQDMTGHSFSLSDYANEKFITESTALSPEMRTFSLKYLRGARAADIDLPIIADIVSLDAVNGNKYSIRPARKVRLPDFETDDDFILLGSPIANPWVGLFDQQMEFRFHFAEGSSSEWIEDAHPAASTSRIFSPVAGGFESKPPTGATYAVVAFLQNPHHRGHVLILAGIGAEGTAAAARLTLNHAEMAAALQKCDLPTGNGAPSFELLLKVNVMAGSALNTDVVACRNLQ